MNRTFPVLAALALCGASFAQTRSSFLGVDSISGIDVTVSNAGLSFLVDTSADPTFTYQNHVYHITAVIGFWNLSDDNDLTASVTGFTGNFGPWSTNSSNSGPGGIAGWKSNPNNGITPGGSEMFTYNSLDSASVERVGFHVVLTENFPGTTGNTGHITTVPEPASMIALVAGLGGLVAKRRRK